MDKKRTLGTTAGMMQVWREAAAGQAKAPSWEEQERAAREKAKVGCKTPDAVAKWREAVGEAQPAPQAQTASSLFQTEAERMDAEAAALREEAQREYNELMNTGE